MDLLIVFLVGGMFGIPYFAALLVVHLTASRLRSTTRTRLQAADTLAIVAPIGVYLVLTHAVDDRQGFFWFLANLVIAAPVACGLELNPPVRARKPWLWSSMVAIAGAVAAWIAWMTVPSAGMTRLF